MSEPKGFATIIHFNIFSQSEVLYASRNMGSATTNLACLSEYLSKEVDYGHQVDVAYFDYRKAFDRVDQWSPNFLSNGPD
jgi:hypothetical protein